MIGVIVPTHNEEAVIGVCLASIRMAADYAGLLGEAVQVFVALDRCHDQTAQIAASLGAKLVHVAGNVGQARAAAADAAIAAGARWIASTDADSRVPPDWLFGQLASAADAFCGVVGVEDWEDYEKRVRVAFYAGEKHCEGHPHVHGANLGVDVGAYVRCGGFPPLPAHEDVALVQALVAAEARIARLPQPMVITSARRHPRVRNGFGDYLRQLEHGGKRRADSASAPILERLREPAPSLDQAVAAQRVVAL